MTMRIPGSLRILQQGVVLRGPVDSSVREFLRGPLQLSDEYVETGIGTILLDGKPVDDIDKAMIRDGATLALSGPMPGLVGATLRRGSRYAVLRDSITHHGENAAGGTPRGGAPKSDGEVTLKLFNMVAEELGEAILARGVWLRKEQLGELLEKAPEAYREEYRRADAPEEEFKGETDSPGPSNPEEDPLVFIRVG